MTVKRKVFLAFFPVIAALLVVALASKNLGAEQSASGRESPGSTLSGQNTDSILQKVKLAIEKNHLSKISSQCLDLELEEGISDGNVIVGVRERHTPTCGGDPSTSPHLFNVQLNRTTNQMWSDAASDDGEMKPIRAP